MRWCASGKLRAKARYYVVVLVEYALDPRVVFAHLRPHLEPHRTELVVHDLQAVLAGRREFALTPLPDLHAPALRHAADGDAEPDAGVLPPARALRRSCTLLPRRQHERWCTHTSA